MTGLALESLGGPAKRADSSSTRIIIIALGAVLCLQLGLAFTKSINWDEFFHYSLIHAYWRGEDGVGILQNPFVVLYGWVPALAGDTIDHIRLIRALIMPFEMLLVGAVIVASTKFTDLKTALLCGLAYVTAGYAFTQGLALRADVISASLLMSALAIGFHRKLSVITLGLIGGLTLLAFVATIKAVLYLPAFLALAVLRWDELKRFFLPLVLLAIASIAALSLLAPDTLAMLSAKLAGAAERMFGGGLVPQHMHWMRQSAMASIFTVMLIGFAFWQMKAKSASKPVLALLALPALWPVIYFNAYPYFFAFILPPVAVALAPVINWAADRYGVATLTTIFSLNAVALFLMEPSKVQANQVEVHELVRSAFPAPVTYIDEAGMIGDFPRAVPQFASGWALNSYLRKGEPLYSQAIMAQPVPLVLANCLTLSNAFSDTPFGERLLPEDEAFLRANYIQHAGIVMVAGKRIEAGETLRGELVAVPGDYRIEDAAILIDGKWYHAGSTVTLDRKRYEFANEGEQSATLRWDTASDPRPSAITFLTLYSGY
ncbi:MAG: hypothetical protein AAGI28_04955 [Pseudomonadota bacterium]